MQINVIGKSSLKTKMEAHSKIGLIYRKNGQQFYQNN